MAGCCVKLSLRAGAGEPPGAKAPQSDGAAGAPQACARVFLPAPRPPAIKAWAARWGLARRRNPQHQSSMCCDISLVTIPF